MARHRATQRLHLPGVTSVLALALLGGLLVLIAAACGGGDTTPESTPSPVPPTATQPPSFTGEGVIYVVAPMSGREASAGQAQAGGARLAAADLNAKGGILQHEITVKVVNDRGDAEGAMAASRKVVQAAGTRGENVIGVVMYGGSDPELTSVSKGYLASGSGLDALVTLPSTGRPITADVGDPRFFRLSASALSQARQVANTFHEQNLRDVVVVYDKTSYGEALNNRFVEAADGLDIRVVESFGITPDDFTYSETVDRVKEINPSGLFFAASSTEASVFLPELFGFEFQGSVIASSRSFSYNLVDQLGCQAEGLQFASLLPSPQAAFDTGQLARYAGLTGRAPDRHSVAGYAGVELIARAYEEAGSLDAGAAGNAIPSTTVETAMGPLALDAQGNPRNPLVHLFQVQGRQLGEMASREAGAGPRETDRENGAAGETLTTLASSEKDPIVFAGLNWDSARFANTIARFIIEAGFGYPTRSVPGSSVPLFQSLREGDVQVYMETWLPNAQQLYDEAVRKGQVQDLGRFYGDAVQGWFVPRYVVEGDQERGIEAMAPDLTSVQDLEQYTSLFASEDRPGLGRLMDGSSGWFSYKIDCMKLKAYRLDDSFAQVTTGSESALFGSLAEAYENGEPILTYVFEPTWPMAGFDLVRLEEPEFNQEQWDRNKGTAFPRSQIKKLVHSDLPDRAPEVVGFLERISLETDEISRILLTMRENDLTPAEAAKQWMQENTERWSKWLEDEQAVEKVKQGLP